MTASAFEPLQHPLQLCILHLKLARQLVPQKPDFFVEIDCIVKSGESAWRRWDNDCNRFRFHAPHAALSRLTFANMRVCIGLVGQNRVRRFHGPRAFDICRVINNACRFLGMIRVRRNRRGMTVKNWLFVRRTVCAVQLVVVCCFSRLGDGQYVRLHVIDRAVFLPLLPSRGHQPGKKFPRRRHLIRPRILPRYAYREQKRWRQNEPPPKSTLQ